MYRDENNKFVPIILDRLQLLYTQLIEENEIQNAKLFSHLNNDQTVNDSTTVKASPRKKSNIL